MSKEKSVIIIGSGPAGLTAAIYLGRDGYKPTVVAGIEFGGQLMNTTIVENYPGFPEGIDGPELMDKFIKQAENWGAKIVYENAEKVDFSGDQKKVFTSENEYSASAVVIASGSSPRRLGIPGEDIFYGRGVSTCAVCDGAFFKDKVVAVIGGGDVAMEDAAFVSRHAKKVYLIHRRDEFRATEIMQQRVEEKENIEIIWNTEVKEVLGDKKVDSIKLFNNKDDSESELKLDGMFLAIGHIPNTDFLGDSIKLDKRNFIVATDYTQTSVDGVFVAGDVNDFRYQQAVTAAGMGCMAAMDAAKWLEILNGINGDK